MNQSKNKQMIIIIIALIIVTATGIMACGQEDKKQSGSSKSHSVWTDTKIPEEFKDYKVLNSGYETDKYETVLIAESKDYMSPSPIRIRWSVNEQVILSIYRSQEEPEPGPHYYKLSRSGEVLDSLYAADRLKDGVTDLYGPYALHVTHKEDYYYTTWPLNGNHQRKSIEILNRKLSWPPEKLEKVYQEIVRNGQYAFNRPIGQPGDGEPDWSLNRIFFVENGKYKVLYKKMKQYKAVPEIIENFWSIEEFYRTSDDQSPDFTQNFKLKHFQPIQKLSYEHSIGGGSPSFSRSGWAGRAFFELPIKRETLKIRKDGIIIETGTSDDAKARYYLSNGEGESVSPFNLNLYTDSRLGFAIYSTGARFVYLIKPKKRP